MTRDQSGRGAHEIADPWWSLENDRGTANYVLADQSRGAARDVLRQAKQRLAKNCRDQNCRGSIDFLSMFSDSQLFMLSS